MYFWTCQTEEVLAMVEWMRRYNQTAGNRPLLSFTSFDMQTYTVALEKFRRLHKKDCAFGRGNSRIGIRQAAGDRKAWAAQRPSLHGRHGAGHERCEVARIPERQADSVFFARRFSRNAASRTDRGSGITDPRPRHR